MAVDVSCGTRPDHCGRCGRLWLSLWRLETWEHWLGGWVKKEGWRGESWVVGRGWVMG